MIKGRVQMGTEATSLLRWTNDALDDCSPYDRIWGWSIRSSEVLQHEKTKIDDDVLCKMLYLGLLDAQSGGAAWTEPTALRQGIRINSNATVQLLEKCLKMDDKVGHPGRLF